MVRLDKLVIEGEEAMNNLGQGEDVETTNSSDVDEEDEEDEEEEYEDEDEEEVDEDEYVIDGDEEFIIEKKEQDMKKGKGRPKLTWGKVIKQDLREEGFYSSSKTQKCLFQIFCNKMQKDYCSIPMLNFLEGFYSNSKTQKRLFQIFCNKMQKDYCSISMLNFLEGFYYNSKTQKHLFQIFCNKMQKNYCSIPMLNFLYHSWKQKFHLKDDFIELREYIEETQTEAEKGSLESIVEQPSQNPPLPLESKAFLQEPLLSNIQNSSESQVSATHVEVSATRDEVSSPHEVFGTHDEVSSD